jgi:small subunit ribosomal protein S16
MVVIRLRRGGRTHDPHYRLVAQEKRSKLNGAYIENLGHYHPTDAAKKLEVNKERLEYWLSQGAMLSPTVTNILVKGGFLPADRQIVRLGVTKKAVVEAPAEEPAETKAETSAEESTEEAPAEETPAEEAPAEEPVVEEVAKEEAPAEEKPTETEETK